MKAGFSRVSQYARAKSLKKSAPYAAQRFNIWLKMTGVASARCMGVRFTFVSLISWLPLNAAVRPHSAWDEAQAAFSVTQVMFPSGCFNLENF